MFNETIIILNTKKETAGILIVAVKQCIKFIIISIMVWVRSLKTVLIWVQVPNIPQNL